MNVLENTLDIPVDAVLDRPLVCHLATVSADGRPRVSPLWYRWDAEQLWILADLEKTYPSRVERQPTVAVSVVDFDPHAARVHHIGMRGTGSLEPFDGDRARRTLVRYLGPDEDDWDPRFHDLEPDRWRFIRFDPETVVARDQSYHPSLPTAQPED